MAKVQHNFELLPFQYEMAKIKKMTKNEMAKVHAEMAKVQNEMAKVPCG